MTYLKRQPRYQGNTQDADWLHGKVGFIQRNNSGKIMRSEPLPMRGADGIREYYDDIGDRVNQ